MTATPGQAAGEPSALYGRWWHEVMPTATNADIASAWRMTFPADRKFWTELDAAQEQHAAPGPLRAALEATLSDWRDDATYRPTDTRDEITEHHAVTGCADTLAGILADHPDTEAQPAPELTYAMAESRRYREALDNVFAVLDRQLLTYAERISYARTLIRTAREGK